MTTTTTTLKVTAMVTTHKSPRGRITGFSATMGNLSSNVLPTRVAALNDLAVRLTQAADDHGAIDLISRPLADGTVWSAVVTSNGYHRVETAPNGTLRLAGGFGGTSGGFESQRGAAWADLRSRVERPCSRCGKVCAYGAGPQGTGAEIALYLVGTGSLPTPFYVCMACDAKPDATAWARGAVPGGAVDAHVMRVWGAGPAVPAPMPVKAGTRITFKVELANKIEHGRAVGNLWGVARYLDGCRNTWVLPPQGDESLAREACATLGMVTMQVGGVS
jgi:hypothetical protein